MAISVTERKAKVFEVGLTRDRWHRYSWSESPAERIGPMPGVTGIVKLQDSIGGSDQLIKWGAGLAADWLLDQWDHSPIAPREVLRLTAVAQTDEPSRIGTAVHEQVRRVLHGEPITPDPETVYHLAHFAAFMGKEKPDVFFAEEMVANIDRYYGGAFDFIGLVRDRVALVDVKTGSLKASHRLQLAGYMDAEFIGRSGSVETIPMPEIEAGYVLLLRADGYELVDQTPTEADREHFRFLAGVHQQLKRWAKDETA